MAVTTGQTSRRSTVGSNGGGSINHRSYSSQSGRFSLSSYNQSSPSSSSTGFASSSTSFASRSSTFLAGNNIRSASPPRVSLYGGPTMSASAVCFSLDRSVSPNRSISTVSPSRSRPQVVRKQPVPKKTCMCSPTTHPGSFRCSLHKNQSSRSGHHSSPNNRLNARRSAMTNSLVRIAGVEGGDLVKRALAALIRPSSHQQRRRTAFQPRPSRLSVMSMAVES